MFQQRDLKGRWECVSRSETQLGVDEFLTVPCMGHHKGWLSEIKAPLPTCHLRWLVMKELHSMISFHSQEVLYGLFNHSSFVQSIYFLPIDEARREDWSAETTLQTCYARSDLLTSSIGLRPKPPWLIGRNNWSLLERCILLSKQVPKINSINAHKRVIT